MTLFGPNDMITPDSRSNFIEVGQFPQYAEVATQCVFRLRGLAPAASKLAHTRPVTHEMAGNERGLAPTKRRPRKGAKWVDKWPSDYQSK
jgi:hypothetical protein